MKKLYAPWRKSYVEKVNDLNNSQEVCPFCEQGSSNEDERYFILERGRYNFVMMNLYPYNAGHLLIIPYAHEASLEDLKEEARTELMALTTQSVVKLKKILGAHGINIGLNLGKASGAGIPAHLHQHVLPRWLGDTNFLPLIAETKQISVDLADIYKTLKAGWHK